MSGPLVSCIMPTYGRRDYVSQSVRMFLAQDYPYKELLILNDCPGQTLHCDAPGVRVFNTASRFPSLGEKRNALIEQAHGEFIAVWDDDDIYLPWRLSFSVAQAYALQTPFYIPAEYWAYWGEKDLHDNQTIQSWVSHPMFLFDKTLWDKAGRYPPLNLGEDHALADQMSAVLGRDWPRFELPRFERFYILRGRSKYHHTSIAGGVQELDTTPGVFLLEPASIEDPVLSEVTDELIASRGQP